MLNKYALIICTHTLLEVNINIIIIIMQIQLIFIITKLVYNNGVQPHIYYSIIYLAIVGKSYDLFNCTESNKLNRQLSLYSFLSFTLNSSQRNLTLRMKSLLSLDACTMDNINLESNYC